MIGSKGVREGTWGAVGGIVATGEAGGCTEVADLKWLIHGGDAGTRVVGVVAEGGTGVAGRTRGVETSGTGVVARLAFQTIIIVCSEAYAAVGQQSAVRGGVAGGAVSASHKAGLASEVAVRADGATIIIVAISAGACGIEQQPIGGGCASKADRRGGACEASVGAGHAY